MTLFDLQKRFQEIARSISNVQRASGYQEYNDLSQFEVATGDSDAQFLRNELTGIMEKLDAARMAIDYLAQPIAETGVLTKNDRGRYELPSGHSFTSGNSIEIMIEDEYTDGPTWKAGAIEHNGTDYYFTQARNMPLQGAIARWRKQA